MDQRIKRTARIWVGVGAAVVVGAGAASSTPKAEEPAAADAPSKALQSQPLRIAQSTQPAHQHGASPAPSMTAAERAKLEAATGDQARPDGEGGEGADGSLDPRVRFYRDLGLIRGHLLVGDELVKEGRWDDAMPHFLHPAEEIYGNIATTLKRQSIRPFQSQLKALAQTVQAKKADAYAAAWKSVDVRLSEAENAIRKFVPSWPQFTMQTTMALLAVAASEYENAIEAGRIGKPVEYQDSRGFVFWADRLLAGLPADLGKDRNEALAKARAELAEIKKIWPTPMPPAAPLKDYAALLGEISRVELAAAPILKP